MTYLFYALWLLSMLWVAGELDRMLSTRYHRFYDREMPQTGSVWFLSPFASCLLPGAGQFLNGQPIKAAFLILWPFLFLLVGLPRPWQMLQLSAYGMLLPWWLIAVIDALAVSQMTMLRSHRTRKREETEAMDQDRQADLDRFLDKRSTGRDPV